MLAGMDMEELTRALLIFLWMREEHVLMGTLNFVRKAVPQETGDEGTVEGMSSNSMSVGLVSWEAGGIADTQIQGKGMTSGLDGISEQPPGPLLLQISLVLFLSVVL